MTFAEVYIEVRARNKRLIFDQQQLKAQAWWTAALMRSKNKLPDLDKFTGSKKVTKKKKQTPEQMFNQMMRMHQAMEGDTVGGD